MGCAASAASRTSDYSRVVPSNSEQLNLSDLSNISKHEIAENSRPKSENIGKRVAFAEDTEQAYAEEPHGVTSRDMTITSEILFQVAENDQVHFDERRLDIYNSFEWPDGNMPRNVALPPGRLEHEINARQVRRFIRGAQRHQRRFRQIIGRGDSSDEEG